MDIIALFKTTHYRMQMAAADRQPVLTANDSNSYIAHDSITLVMGKIVIF